MGWLDLFRRKKHVDPLAAFAAEPPPEPAVIGRGTCGRVLFLGGPGDTLERAVLIRGAPSQGSGIRAEYDYLIQCYGRPGADWTLEHQSLVYRANDQGPCDELLIRLVDGSFRLIYFDLSECFAKRVAHSGS